MDSVRYDRRARAAIPLALKILIAGGFGAGKTTLVSAVSEIRPLQTEEVLTGAGHRHRRHLRRGEQDHHHGGDGLRPDHHQRRPSGSTCSARPGQDRFWFLWDELAFGALGAVVLADTRRLADCFPPSTTSSSGASRSWSR